MTLNLLDRRRIAALVMLFSFAGAASAESVVRLRDSIVVTGVTVFLSDLLPAGAPSGLRKLASAIPLARSPILGASRSFGAAEIAAELKKYSVPGHFQIPDTVTVCREGWSIDPQAVRSAIQTFLEAHETAAPSLLELSTLTWARGIKSLSPGPILEVAAMDPDPVRSQTNFRVRCLDPAACREFLVEAKSLTPQPPVIQPSRIGPASGRAAVKRPALVRTGSRMLLRVSDGNVQIFLPVVCLQKGSLGDSVRARDPLTRRIYQAKVVSPRNLLAEF